ncbi:MAG: SNF2-related protein [Marinifilaceae bacterium]|jgi:SNF2 family DNA or RNA helicase|nr:SNF2-related protein [Marinifilaceae bacterium]
MNKKELFELIDRNIEYFSSSQVKARGRKLYELGRVNILSYSEEKDKFHIEVFGSVKYDIIINGLSKRSLTSSCSCPYTWGVMCKHRVAALLELKDSIANGQFLIEGEDTEKSKEKGKKKEKGSDVIKKVKKHERGDNGFKLKSYKNINLNDYDQSLRKYSNKGEIIYREDNISDYFYMNEDSEIIVDINDSYFEEENKVIFRKIDNKVYIDIENGRFNYFNEFSPYEYAVLRYLSSIDSSKKSPFTFFFSKAYQDVINNLMHDFDFSSEKELKKNIDIFYSIENGSYYQPKTAEFQNIISVKNLSSYLRGFKSLSDNLNSHIIPTNTHSQYNNYELGFKFRITDYTNETNEIEIKAFTAKLNKARTKMISNFQDLGIEDIQIPVKDEYADFVYSNKYETLSSNSYQDFILLNKAFNLLQNNKFVFYDNSPDFEFNIKKKDLDSVKVSNSRIKFSLKLTDKGNYLILEPIYMIDDQDFTSSINSDAVVNRLANSLFLFESFQAYIYSRELELPLMISAKHKDAFLNEIIIPLSKHVNIEFNSKLIDVEKLELDFKTKQIYLSEEDDNLIITPSVEYKNGAPIKLNNQGNIVHKDNNEVKIFYRNFDLENDFLDEIAQLHPKFEEQKAGKIFALNSNEFMQDLWFYKFYEQLQNSQIEVFGMKELKNFKYSPYKAKITSNISSGIDWFELNLKVSFGDNHVKLADIKKAIINKQKFIQLKDGSVGIMPEEWIQKFEKYFRHAEIKKDKLEISKLKFSIVDELFDSMLDNQIIEEIALKRQKLRAFKEISTIECPQELNAELRPYQKEGLNWLNFLDEMGWGGILADDMGLGKTIQILSFILKIVKKDSKPNLIVVPTTLLFNWENEIKKFAPSLKYHFHYGNSRGYDNSKFDGNDLIFTTYGILLRDIEFISAFEFNYAILDESQAIKNPSSRRYKACNLINARNKIALTGTPIENSTFDLYAQMNFVNPGFLGGVKNFKDNFSNPIDKESDEQMAAELQKTVNPFILRRTKEQVATELPEKTENIIYCEMGTAQRKVYDAFRNEYKEKLMQNIEAEGIGKSKMMVLEALTKLRLICDSPKLTKNDEIIDSESAKLDELMQHISEKTSNHKILVFSQFVKMLDLVKTELNKRNIAYEYLDGQSSPSQREISVKNFQENPELRVFLISLKAGGTGLNLTAADYVYLMDPWWNPAVENQAIDRCYRIGQDKKVFAYRMICKNTIEEKILLLQAKKKKLAGDIIHTDEGVMKNLSVKDIQDLFD